MSDADILVGKKILVVDDEPDILEVLVELLDNCDVLTASTFQKAKKLLESNDFDIAVLDIMGVDGYGLLDLANKRNIPAVMLTAHAFTPDNLLRTVKEGACSYIPKEEISDIAVYLTDVLTAREKGENPWDSWQERLPSSYFEKRWGAAWKSMDKSFLNELRDNIKKRSSRKT